MSIHVNIEGGEDALPSRNLKVLTAYALAGEWLKAAMATTTNVRIGTENREHQVLSIPAIVSTAFAAELYFKAALLAGRDHEAEQIRRHHLGWLYGKLSEAQKAALRSHMGVTEAAFNGFLPTVADAFVEWRYLHENVGQLINTDFLGRLARAAQAVASEAMQ